MNKRDKVFELLGELKLRGIKADYDEVVGQGIQKRQSFENILLNLLQIELSERRRKSIQYQLATSKVHTIKNLDQFKELSDLIVANRITEELNDVMDKVYTRDLFNSN